MEPLLIRSAGEDDIPVILELIRRLAAYERSSECVEINAELLREFVFCARPMAEVYLAYWEGEPAGYAIILPKFYSYRGRPSLYLEDLFVDERLRGKGIGRRMMEHVARIALERGCPFLEWSVLDWNEPAVGFYRRLGAQRVDDRSHYYLDRQGMGAVAGG